MVDICDRFIIKQLCQLSPEEFADSISNIMGDYGIFSIHCNEPPDGWDTTVFMIQETMDKTDKIVYIYKDVHSLTMESIVNDQIFNTLPELYRVFVEDMDSYLQISP